MPPALALITGLGLLPGRPEWTGLASVQQRRSYLLLRYQLWPGSVAMQGLPGTGALSRADNGG